VFGKEMALAISCLNPRNWSNAADFETQPAGPVEPTEQRAIKGESNEPNCN
jgi:hypothetical protein